MNGSRPDDPSALINRIDRLIPILLITPIRTSLRLNAANFPCQRVTFQERLLCASNRPFCLAAPSTRSAQSICAVSVDNSQLY